MYAQYFGLRQEPFSIAPDPRYLFMSERHREALAHLLYGVNGGGGFVLLTGEVGAGKTTVCRCFLGQIPQRCNVAYIFNPKLTVPELLKSVCDEFRIVSRHIGPGVATVKDYVDALNGFLLRAHAAGQNNLLIIDEAQSLSADVLEQLRLLTNLETDERKLLQIILIGQPELRTMLARPELEQLAQRVIARFHLDALSEAETVQYIRHRLAVAGRSGSNPFDTESMRRIHKLAGGVPRRINLLADRALLGAYATGRTRVKRDVVDKAAGEVFDRAPLRLQLRPTRLAWLGLGALAGAALAGVIAFALGAAASRKPATATAGAPAAASAPRAAQPAPARAASAAPTAVAAAPAASPAAPSAPVEPAAIATLRDEKQAWRELAAVWQVALSDEEVDPCQAAQRQRVHCFRSSGANLALVRQLDRPGLVALHDDGERPAYALLTALTEQHATLRSGGASHNVTLASFAKAWRGEFATFWRAPPGYVDKLLDSASPPGAEWLAARLARVGGELQPGEKQSLDTALKTRLRAFQSAQGLKVDGLAGPLTLMQLNRATGVDEPRLAGNRAPAQQQPPPS